MRCALKPVVHSRATKLGPTSLAINFAPSGAICDKCKCAAFCYAKTAERRYKEAYLKLRRHQRMGPVEVLRRAAEELPLLHAKHAISWVRFCSLGSMPAKQDTPNWPDLVAALQEYLRVCKQIGAEVHFPLESRRKAQAYQAATGDLAVVRQTVQTNRSALKAQGPISFVVGDRPRRVIDPNPARALARRRHQLTGRKTIVCPAIVNHGVACDKCRACSKDHIDVLYPAHM